MKEDGDITVPVLLSIKFKEKRENLITIPIMVNINLINAILDSGACISLVTRKLCHSLEVEPLDTKEISLLYANETRDLTNSYVNITISFTNISQVLRFYVVNKLPCYEMLLGLNFFRTYKLLLDFKGDNLRIISQLPENDINKICLIDNEPKQELTTFHTTQEHKLLPRSETMIQLKTNIKYNGFAMIETNQKLIDLFQVYFCDCIVTITNGMIRIPITNLNSYPVYIPNNLIMAVLVILEQEKEDVEQFDVFNVTKVGPEDYSINPALPVEQQDKLRTLLNSFAHLFPKSIEELTQTNLIVHKIQLIPGSKPVYCRLLRRSEFENELINKEIRGYCKSDIAEPSTSPYSSPLLLVKKPGINNWRVVSDFRLLNKQCVRDVYLLPNQSTVLQELGGSKYFSQLDCFSGYFQIPLHPESRPLTAFLTPEGLFQYKVLPMGLLNSGSVFSRCMDLAFQAMKKDTITYYLDDCAVLGRDFNHHLDNLRKVLKRLEEVNLKLKKSKCSFGQTEISFLGFLIDGKGIRPNPEKVRPILEMKQPKTVREVQSFLGCVNFYRKMIKDHSKIAVPLYDITKKGQPFKWTQSCEEAFQHFKTVLTTPPILALYDESLPVILECDGSKVGLGGIISQLKDKKSVVIEYHSRSTSDCEKRYTSTELELAAVCWIISRARCYIFNKRFTLITDHSCLRYLHNLKSPFGRLARMQTYLAEYSFEVIHRPGIKHANCDLLSRLPLSDTIDNSRDTDLDDRTLFLTKVDDSILTKEILIKEQENDPYCIKIFTDIKFNKSVPFSIVDKLLVKNVKTFTDNKELIVIPIKLMNRIIKIFHDDSAHEMALKVYLKMKSRYFHPKLFKFVECYTRSCDKCQRRNPSTQLTAGSSDLMPTSSIPFDALSIDLIGVLPTTGNNHRYILVVVCIATRYVIARPLKTKTMAEVVSCLLDNVFYQVGFPRLITTDRGTEFLNSLLSELTKQIGIDHRKTTSYHPNSNSIVERMNRNINIAISKKVNRFHDDWDVYLQAICFGLNSSVHTATKEIPFSLVYSKPISTTTDILFPPSNPSLKIHRELIKEMRETAEKRIQMDQFRTQERRNEKLIDSLLRIGEKCYVKKLIVKTGRAKKFTDRYKGPYTVLEMLKDGLYRVQNDENRKEEIVNRTNLRKCYERNEINEEIIVNENEKEIIQNEKEINHEEENDEEEEYSIEFESSENQKNQPDQLTSSVTGTLNEVEGNNQGNIEENANFHSSLPDLSSLSIESTYHDAMTGLASQNDNINNPGISTPVIRTSSRVRNPPNRLGYLDLGTSQNSRNGGRNRAVRQGRKVDW